MFVSEVFPNRSALLSQTRRVMSVIVWCDWHATAVITQELSGSDHRVLELNNRP